MNKKFDFEFRQFTSVERLLDEARDLELDNIAIVGSKDGELYHCWANIEDSLHLVGALDILKTHVINDILLNPGEDEQ
jgi:hypothetical protein